MKSIKDISKISKEKSSNKSYFKDEKRFYNDVFRKANLLMQLKQFLLGTLDEIDNGKYRYLVFDIINSAEYYYTKQGEFLEDLSEYKQDMYDLGNYDIIHSLSISQISMHRLKLNLAKINVNYKHHKKKDKK